RLRQQGEPSWGEFEGDGRTVPGAPVGRTVDRPGRLVVVRAVGGSHDGEEGPDDPVMVEGGDVVERGTDPLGELLLSRPAGTPRADAVGTVRVEPCLEQLDEHPRDLRVLPQRRLDVLAGED